MQAFEDNGIIKKFPNVELPYETHIHKEFLEADMVCAIPHGRKCFAWFVSHKNEYLCLVLEVTSSKQICKIERVSCTFEPVLAHNVVGTLFFGTVFTSMETSSTVFFCVEHLCFHHGCDVQSRPLREKLHLLKSIFSKEIQQQGSAILFGLPVMGPSSAGPSNAGPSNAGPSNAGPSLKPPYVVAHYQYRCLDKRNGNHCFNFNPVAKSQPQKMLFTSSKKAPLKEKSAVFQVKPDIQCDIYYLYTETEDKSTNEHFDDFYNVAYIPDYATSVMMNGLFRQIKENHNLDSLEESDDDEEFENTNEDKFVHINTCHRMVCVFNHRFHKWTPVRLALPNEKTISKNDLFRLEKI